MERLKQLIDQSEYCVAFTGAGISTLSGISDFRGKDGFYKRNDIDPNKIFELNYFMSTPEYYYTKSKNFIYDVDQKEPNIVHKVLAKLEQEGKVKTVITQNIDMLHQKAGTKNIIEIHGTPALHHCLKCGEEYTYDEIVEIIAKEPVPYCRKCGGLVKPDIIFFGEMLDETAINRAVEESSKADLMLILGSSLVVQPAASLPLYTKRNGGKFVIVNNEPTPLDYMAEKRYDDLREVFEELS